ncbi:MAG: excinuclease ABC subunit UvrA [Candidatus Omnitrophica bacterium]|nr:excinuclease ABC subunit UvrA [Candidatus Omnitrophota bacterium]
MDNGKILIRGAREHNLAGFDLELPRNRLIVITGLSGSGKSSLAFDTLYAEGQRRYMESLSSYARQFLEQMKKPDVDLIEGLSPAISIEQRSQGASPRSTVGTTTEIYDYLRLLYAKIGRPFCYRCGRPIQSQDAEAIADQILSLKGVTQVEILSPWVRGRKGEYVKLFEKARREGFVRVKVDGEIRDLAEPIPLDKKIKHAISVVVDRIDVSPKARKRIVDSVETALRFGEGLAAVQVKGRSDELIFSERFSCAHCGISYEAPEPRSFSFNSPYGACRTCSGLGTRMDIDSGLVVQDERKTLREGAIEPWQRVGGRRVFLHYRRKLQRLGERLGFDLDTPYKKLAAETKKIILFGEREEDTEAWWPFEGVIPNLERRFRETESDFIKTEILKYMNTVTCPACKGARLRPESLAVKVGPLSIVEATRLSIRAALEFFEKLELSERERKISRLILKEVRDRLRFLDTVGLGYLSLDRMADTLSGGEAQRIRLATQIASRLVGVLYVLDEPSIGLHQRDNRRLLETLKALRDLGNTLVVVEHDEETIRSADYIVDLGPGAGAHGGRIVAQGRAEDIMHCQESLTGRYLRGELVVPIPKRRETQGPGVKFLEIVGAREHNLKDIHIRIPLSSFTCVTGVSGSGKSTLVDDILYRALAQKFYHAKETPGRHREIRGLEHIDKVIVIDQSPIGRTPRSNPATYTGLFTFMRGLFAQVPEARVRGYRPGRFSFNVKGGRCETCQGDGIIKIQMHFLPDVYVPCESCKGKRYNRQTLEVRFKGLSIAECLELTVEEALKLFVHVPSLRSRLEVLNGVGLGYIHLGQPAPTLSGGEAQRVKLATELARRATGRTLYLLDEPTTGLHFADVSRLLAVLAALRDQGNTIVVIEHNLDVVKCADYILDLGPEGGEAGGEVIAAGTPEEVMATSRSYTGRFLKQHMGRHRVPDDVQTAQTV